jgi:hypothetical protein
VRLDLNFAAQLVLDTSLAQLALVEHLECDNEVRLLLAREVDLSELAVSERLADVEVGERPLAQGLGSSLALRRAGVRQGDAAGLGR